MSLAFELEHYEHPSSSPLKGAYDVSQELW